MQIRTQVDAQTPEELATLLRGILVGYVVAGAEQFRRYSLPPLYRSGIKWKRSPSAKSWEDFALPLTIYERRWGDCDNLVVYRCSELCANGTPALPKIYWRINDGKVKIFHAEVRILKTGLVEDPSRLLGM